MRRSCLFNGIYNITCNVYKMKLTFIYSMDYHHCVSKFLCHAVEKSLFAVNNATNGIAPLKKIPIKK